MWSGWVADVEGRRAKPALKIDTSQRVSEHARDEGAREELDPATLDFGMPDSAKEAGGKPKQ